MGERARKNGATKTYPLRLPVYENEEGRSLLQEIARRRGCSMAAAVRQVIREEAAREGLAPSGATRQQSEATEAPAEERKPFWQRAVEIARSIPQEERERFPADGSEQLDHYVYGVPKRGGENG